jgi:hypothetical protein
MCTALSFDLHSLPRAMGTNALEEPAASIFRMPVYLKTEVVTLLARR